MGLYSFINPFLYIYFSLAIILMFSAIGNLSILPVTFSAGAAAALILSGISGGKINGLAPNVFFANPAVSLIISQFAVFIVIPLAFSFAISKGYGIAKAIYIPAAVIFACLFIAAAIFIGELADLHSMAGLFAGSVSAKLIEAYRQMNIGYLTTPKMEGLIREALKTFFFFLPGILVIFSWMGIWISYITLRKVFSKTGNGFYNNIKNLLLWKSSDYFIIFLICGITISTFSVGIYKFIGYNIILLSASVYLVQGLTIAAFFFNKFNLNLFFRIIGYSIVILFANPFLIFIILAGVFDMWFDFRKIDAKKQGGQSA